MDLCVSEQYILVCIGMNLHPVLGFHKTIILASCVLVRNIQPRRCERKIFDSKKDFD